MKLENWVNPEYVQLFREGKLSSLRKEDPFTSAVLPNFFNQEVAERLRHFANNTPVEEAHGKGLAKDVTWYWGAFADLQYIRFFLGQEMRAFMNELLGEQLVLKPKVYPQFNIFKPQSRGIPIHTDLNEQIAVVTLLQLSEGWTPGGGGELVLYSRENGKYVAKNTIAPEFNKLILFKVSAHSYHGVEDMKGNWERRTITYDWQSKVEKQVEGKSANLLP